MAPLSTAVPLPVLVSALAPLMMPLRVSCVPLTSMVVPEPRAMVPASEPEPLLLASVPLRVTASAPMVWPLRSSVVPAATLTPPATVPKAVALPAVSVPAVSVVAPL